jgi:hypothetical protein
MAVAPFVGHARAFLFDFDQARSRMAPTDNPPRVMCAAVRKDLPDVDVDQNDGGVIVHRFISD